MRVAQRCPLGRAYWIDVPFMGRTSLSCGLSFYEYSPYVYEGDWAGAGIGPVTTVVPQHGSTLARTTTESLSHVLQETITSSSPVGEPSTSPSR